MLSELSDGAVIVNGCSSCTDGSCCSSMTRRVKCVTG